MEPTENLSLSTMRYVVPFLRTNKRFCRAWWDEQNGKNIYVPSWTSVTIGKRKSLFHLGCAGQTTDYVVCRVEKERRFEILSKHLQATARREE
jgi:hypothetical protein